MSGFETDSRGIPAQLFATANEAVSLVKAEMELADAEIKAGVSKIALGALFAVVALLLAQVALFATAITAIAALQALGLSPVAAGLVTLLACLSLLGLAGYVAWRLVRLERLVPKRAIRNLKQDFDALTGGAGVS